MADLRTDEPSSPDLLAKLGEALQVLRDTDVRRYLRLSKDIEWVAAAYHPYAHASYLQDVNAITIGSHILAQQDARVIASYLVHEGTHARIKSAGAAQGGAKAARAERRCWLEQQAFVHRLENADAIKAWIDGIVRSEPWSRHRTAEADVMTGKLSMLESSSLPHLAKRVLRWLLLLQQRSRA